jgi:hypothetical protein
VGGGISGFRRESQRAHFTDVDGHEYVDLFHNMALVCPATSASDVDVHTEVFAEATSDLLT